MRLRKMTAMCLIALTSLTSAAEAVVEIGTVGDSTNAVPHVLSLEQIETAPSTPMTNYRMALEANGLGASEREAAAVHATRARHHLRLRATSRKEELTLASVAASHGLAHAEGLIRASVATDESLFTSSLRRIGADAFEIVALVTSPAGLETTVARTRVQATGNGDLLAVTSLDGDVVGRETVSRSAVAPAGCVEIDPILGELAAEFGCLAIGIGAGLTATAICTGAPPACAQAGVVVLAVADYGCDKVADNIEPANTMCGNNQATEDGRTSIPCDPNVCKVGILVEYSQLPIDVEVVHVGAVFDVVSHDRGHHEIGAAIVGPSRVLSTGTATIDAYEAFSWWGNLFTACSTGTIDTTVYVTYRGDGQTWTTIYPFAQRPMPVSVSCA